VQPPWIVAGGGVGGLAAALTPAREGRHATVLEQEQRLGEIGAGIQLGPCSFRPLELLKMPNFVRAVSEPVSLWRHLLWRHLPRGPALSFA
jgi:2-polyprenyl-6-methoxyphenol hydroxylase-like FAD-dependent oxidoreductase